MIHFTRDTVATGRKALCKMKMVVSGLLTLVTVFAFTAISAQRIDATGSGQTGIKGLTSEQEKQVRATLKKNAETLRFLENKGQVQNSDVLYYFEGLHGSTYIEKNRIRFVAKEIEYVDVEQSADNKALATSVKNQEPRMKSAHTFTLYLDGSKGNSDIELGDEFTTSYNYMLGATESEWITDVKAAKDLTIKSVYPGIDLRLYSNADGSFEFDWIVAAGADFNNVKMRFEGQDAINIAKDGSLEVGLRFTNVRFNIPESFQITPAGKTPVDFSFVKNAANLVGFSTKATIDNRYPIVIDPTLSWGTFFDGNVTGFDQYLFAIQVDTDGIVYCAGGSNQQIATGSAPYDANGYLNSVSGFSTSSATPRVAIVYRISADGSDLLDMTLYGPSTVVNDTGSDTDTNVIAYGLSLSADNVFICGKTNSTIPTTGSPFDNSKGGTYDGFVAVFTKDLGTLNYATYLGSSSSEDPGATSIRAISNTSFVVGLTAEGSLPAAYITAGVADNSIGGTDMYIAKFTSYNTISWGTYVGGSDNETFNDLEVFADGRVAFAGYGVGQLTETNSAAGRSTGTGNEDGIIGVLNATGTAFNYLDEIGGSNNDEINDVQIVGSTLYWTGSAESGFPTSSGAYDTGHNGGLDAVVGSVGETGGTASYKCTFYGGSGDEIGSGIRPVNQVDCDGIVNSFLLVFGTSGTSGSGLPTLNINSDPFFDSSNNGGLDMFFAGFASDMGSLQYATLMGGSENDYLGDTGSPRGANHLWTNGANVYLGTTTHSASHSPVLVGNGGFDTVKTNNNDPASDDTHLILGIEFASLLGSDYGDAPAGYGSPAHVLDCPNLYLGSFVDDEASHQSSANANGDDNLVTDDEDSVTVLPILVNGSGQTFSITVNSMVNTTGSTANLYAWIDLNGDGQFGVSEFVSTTVANGFVGSKTLTWSGVTVSGNAANRYLRVRITTDALTDNGGTASLDERSSAGASNGEVEDYRCTSLSCPVAQTEAACQTQAAINAKYQAWIATATYGSPCGGGITVTSPSAPDVCVGGTATITIEFENPCGDKFDCTSTFTVSPPSTPGISCPANQITASCLTQTQVNELYTAWLASAMASGGCNGSLTNDGGNAPNACTGGTKNVTFTYTTSCAAPVTCMASFTVPAAPAIVLTCPSNTTSAPCLTQSEANAAFVAWLGTATASGGCNGVLTNDGGTIAPSVETGGSKLVTFTYTSTCGATTTTCTATYTVAQCCDIDVDAGPDVVTCPPINTILTATITGAQDCETPGYNDCTHAVVATTGFAETPSASGICGDNAGTKLHTASGQGVSSLTLDFGSNVPAGTQMCVRMKLEHCNNATNPSNQSNAKIEVATVQAGPYTVIAASVLFTGGYQDFCYNLGSAARYVKITDNSGCAFRVDYVNVSVPGIPDTGVDYAWSGPGIVGASNGASVTVNQYGTYTVTVTDCAGCVDTDEVIVSENQVPPTLVGVPDDTSAPCDQIPPVAVVTATDAFGNPLVVVFDSETTSGCPYTITRTWTATDGCGNITEDEQVITVTDEVDPVFTVCPQGADLGCNPTGVPAPGNAVATDNCGTPTITSALGQINEDGCYRSQVRTYTATDACGNVAYCYQTFSWKVDVTGPTFTFCPPSQDLGCNPTFVPAPGDATATDVCGSVTITSALGPISEDGCYRSQVRTYTATDACGNQSQCTQTFTWKSDLVDPVFTSCPEGGYLGCNPAGIPEPGIAIATDNCGEPTIDVLPGDITVVGCTYSFTRTYRATDACGNDAFCYQTYTWKVDNDGPTFTFCPEGANLGCNPTGVPAPGQATAVDNCPGDVTITSALGPISEDGCYRSQVRTYTATDACGNESHCYQTFSWTSDTTDPVFTSCPQGGDLGCNPAGIPDPGVAVATDNCGTPTVSVLPGDIIANGCFRSYTRTYKAVDACGNDAFCYQVFTWKVDVTDPILEDCPAPTAAYQCYANVPTPADVKAFDNCDGVLDVVFTETQSDTLSSCNNTIVRTWTATDECGNSASCSQIIVVNDTEKPTFNNIPENVNGQCGEIPLPSLVTADDNCDLEVEIVFDEDTLSETCPITILRRWTATDDCGNSDFIEQTITFDDTVNPVFTVCPQGGNLGCNPEEIPAAGGAEATDNCGVPSITSFPGDIVADGCYRSFTRTYVATDYCGNTAYCYQVFTWTVDTEGPTFTYCPQGGNLGCNPILFPGPGQATATDNCGGDVTITSSLGIISEDGCYRSQVRTYTATDACGNENYCYQTYSWTVDVEGPTFTFCPESQDLGCNPTFIPGPGNATATDNCNGEASITSALGTISEDGCYRYQTRTYTATDACGNESTCAQTFTWKVDLIDPVLEDCPIPTAVYQCYDDVPTPADVKAFDTCDGVLDVVFTETQSDTLSSCNNTIVRTWTATDECGNDASCSQIIYVNDTEKPTFNNIPEDVNGQCGEIPLPSLVTADDNCDWEVEIVFDEDTLSETCPITILRRWTATDDCGNSDFIEQTITFDDTVNPVFTVCPQGGNLGCNPEEIPAAGGAEATDNCGVPSITSFPGDIIADGCYRSFTRTYVATDYCGNTAYCYQVYTWTVDTTPPVFTECPQGGDLGCNPILFPGPGNASATDNCGGDVTITSALGPIIEDGCLRTQIRTYTATDACGNEGYCYQTYTWTYDVTDPTIFGTPLESEIEVACYGEVPPMPQVGAYDECSGPLMVVFTQTETDTLTSCDNTITRTWTATDYCQNVASWTQTIHVHDSIPPMIYCPADMIVGCTEEVPAPDTASVTAFDNCGGYVYVQWIGDTYGDTTCVSRYIIERTYSVTDICGNVSYCTQEIGVYDSEGPELLELPDPNISCSATGEPQMPLFQDNCGGQYTVTYDDDPADGGNDDSGCTQTMIRHWSAVDACGNETIVDQLIIYTDTENPTVEIALDDITVECLDELPTEVPTFEDNCDLFLDITADTTINVVDSCVKIVHIVWTAWDECGNSVSSDRDITIQDTTDPTVTYADPEEIWVQCFNDVPEFVVEFADNCDDSLTIQGISGIALNGCEKLISRSWIATDDCGNSIARGQLVHVLDTIDPTIEASGEPELWVECGDDVPPIYVVFDDNCDNELQLDTISGISPLDCGYIIYRSVIATDDCGNETTFSQAVHIIDTTDPTISCPDDVQVTCSFDVPWPSTTAVSAWDECSNVTIAHVGDVVTDSTCVNRYVIERTYSATDACGNVAYCTQYITVYDDVNPEFLYVPQSSANCNETIDFGWPIATDNCEGNVTITFEDSEITDNGQGGCYYSVTRTWIATDDCGNYTTAEQVVTISDQTDPTITYDPADYTVQCLDEVTPDLALFADNCDLDLTITPASSIMPLEGCAYQIYRTWTATDDCGNSITAEQTITIEDTTDPEVTYADPEEIWVQCFDDVPEFVVDFTDNCDDSLTIEGISGIGFNGCEQLISRSWIATDDCGNSVSRGQLVHILDTIDPVVLTAPADIDVACDGIVPVAVAPTFDDNCDEELTVVYDTTITWLNCGFVIHRTWTAYDDCENSVVVNQYVNGVDEVDPIIDPYFPFVTVECGELDSVEGITASDNCGDVTITSDDSEVSGGCFGWLIRDYTVTDACGNEAYAQIIIEVIDTTPPVIENPDDFTVECDDVPASMPEVEVYDNCGYPVEITEATSTINPINACTYEIIWHWEAVDYCGNVAEATTVVTVTDWTNPTLVNVPASATYECDEEWAITYPTANDNCGNAWVVTEIDTVQGDCPSEVQYIYAFRAIDNCGNQSPVQYTYINIEDTTDPVFDQDPSDESYQCLDIEDYVPQVLTAHDNCGLATVTHDITDDVNNCGDGVWTVTYTAEDECGNTATTSYNIYVEDTEEPIFNECPEDIQLECGDEVPAPITLTAWDACDNTINVVMVETTEGDVPVPGTTADCEILTPVRPAANTCGYPVDWGMALFGLPKVHRFYRVENGQFLEYPNGTITITADFINVYDATKGWHASVTFWQKKDWIQWSTQNSPASYKADCGGVGPNHVDWFYYKLKDMPGVELVGFGGYANSTLNLKHAPANGYFGFQLGVGANNYNAAYGFGGWFTYNGTFKVNNVPYGSATGYITGAGDFAFELDCCPDYQITRTYTATDCSGNVAECVQVITMGNMDEARKPIVYLTPNERIDVTNIQVNPNPTNGSTWFTFTTVETAKTTLELYDMAGKKVTDIFIGELEEGESYTVDYNAESLATGFYLYRLTNGTTVEQGKLIVNK